MNANEIEQLIINGINLNLCLEETSEFLLSHVGVKSKLVWNGGDVKKIPVRVNKPGYIKQNVFFTTGEYRNFLKNNCCIGAAHLKNKKIISVNGLLVSSFLKNNKAYLHIEGDVRMVTI